MTERVLTSLLVTIYLALRSRSGSRSKVGVKVKFKDLGQMVKVNIRGSACRAPQKVITFKFQAKEVHYQSLCL